MTRKICRCGEPSIPGLKSGVALCQYHYNERMWGTAWADACRKDYIDTLHQQAVRLVERVTHQYRPSERERKLLADWLKRLTAKIGMQAMSVMEKT